MGAIAKLFSAGAVALALSAAAASPSHATTFLTTFANFADDINGPTTFKFTNNGRATNAAPPGSATFTGTGRGTFSFRFADFLGVDPSVAGQLSGVTMTLTSTAKTGAAVIGPIIEQNLDTTDTGHLVFKKGTHTLLTINFTGAQLWGSAGAWNFKGSNTGLDSDGINHTVTFSSPYVDFSNYVPEDNNFAIALTSTTNVTRRANNHILTSFVAHGTGGASVGVAVPEPATWGLMVMGFGGMGAMLRNKRRKTIFAA